MYVADKEPFYDDYVPEKKYRVILALPGRVEQAREFTQLQTMVYDYLGRLGSALYNNGTIIDGCGILIPGDNTVVISSGRIFLDGLIRLADASTIQITGTSTELITAKIQTTIVTEVEDTSLLDPAQGHENFGQEGAYRIKEEVVFALDDPDGVPIYQLLDGNLVSSPEGIGDSTITEILARRTYDTSGNYKVSGLDLYDRNEVNDLNQILISLSSGKAYIRGFEVEKLFATTVALDKALDYRSVLAEPKIYNSGISNYMLNNRPVKAFTGVTAQVQVVDNITRGNVYGGIDYLPRSPVVSIVSITQASTTYVAGTDYQLTVDGVDWSPNGAEPSIGSTYQVTYRYNKQLVETVDFQLYTDPTTGYDYVNFIGGDLPVSGSQFNVNYEYYLARRDLVCLSKDGELIILKGRSDKLADIKAPVNQDEDLLAIGAVTISPNSSNVDIINYNNKRLSQADLYRMKMRLDDLEYNIADANLDREAIDTEAATSLKGVYTDGFIGLTKCDYGDASFDCSIDIDNQELSLPISTTIYAALPNEANTATKISKLGNIITAPYTERYALRQQLGTTAMLVNPYSAFAAMALIDLNPAVDNWVDTSTITVNKTETKYYALRRWWGHMNESWWASERDTILALTGSTTGTSGTSTSVSSEVVLDEAILYMRQISIQVTGSNFPAMADNIACYFDNRLIPANPTGSTLAGTNSGTIRSNANGAFTCQITVPPNVPCGDVQLEFKAAMGNGSAIYRAQGRKLAIQETVLTTTNIINYYDPLAQSFQFDVDTTLVAVNLFFGSKDTNKAVTVQIRNMVNGYPGTTCYAAVNVPASAINTSTDSSAVTKVNLNQPVYCAADTQYCLCILSDSDLYSLYIAELGGRDFLTNQVVASQPYGAGVLFSSSNNLTWTSHQLADLKMDLIAAQYDSANPGVLMFNDINTSSISRIVLAASALDYKNMGVDWYFRTSTTGTWLPIESFAEKELGSVQNFLQMRAIINCSSNNSPFLTADAITVVGMIEVASGVYISRNVIMSEEFDSLKVIVDIAKPSGTDVVLYYKNEDISNTWMQYPTPTSITPISNEFSRYEYNMDITPAHEYRIRIQMSTSNVLFRPRIKRLMNLLKY